MVAAIARNSLPEYARLTQRDTRQPITKAVVIQKVEMLVGHDWIITRWPDSRTVTGVSEPWYDAPLLREPFLRRVHYLLSQSIHGATGETGSDLGLTLARALVDTYGATHRMMQDWLADWELDFSGRLRHGSPEDLKEAGHGLDALSATVAEARRRVTGLQYIRTDTQDRSWLPATVLPGSDVNPKEQHVLAEPLKKALADHDTALERQTQAIRADMDLAILRSTAAQQEANEKLQRRLGVVTWFVLVPTLIAGVFGANTALPGGQTWRGFGLMMLIMAVSVVVATLAHHATKIRAWVTRRLPPKGDVSTRDGHSALSRRLLAHSTGKEEVAPTKR